MPNRTTRRHALQTIAAASAAMVGTGLPAEAITAAPDAHAVVCVIRYQIDPFQRDNFARYAKNWGAIIPRCGGRLIGYFLPWQGTNDIGWGWIGCESLAAYEAYQARLRRDPEALANFDFAREKRIILREERNFVEGVPGTLHF